MLGRYISDSFLQIMSQLFLFGIFAWMIYSSSKNKKKFIFLSLLFLLLSCISLYDIWLSLILSLIYLLLILKMTYSNERYIVLVCFLGYLSINKFDFFVHVNDETLSYMMLKIIFSGLYLFIYQLFIIITKRITSTRTLFIYQTLLFIICMISHLFVFMSNQTMIKEMREILYIPIFVVSLLYIIISILLISFIHQQETREIIRTQEIKNTALLNQYYSLREKYEDISILKHDIKSHLQSIYILNTQRKYDQIEEYLKKYLENIQEYSLYFHSSHPMFEIVVNEKYNEAKKLNVDFQIDYTDINFHFIDDRDIISIFANALGNALEANEEVMIQRFISMKVAKKGNYCVFQIKNPYQQIYNNYQFLSSTKKGHEGVGLISIQKVIKKYQGMITYETKNSIFILTIMIPFKQ